MRSILPSLLFLLLTAGASSADDAKPFSSAFEDFCLSHGPHFTAMSEAAKDKDWTPLAADMAMSFTPVSEPITIEGWLIGDGNGSRFEALVGYRSKIGDKPVEGCSAALSGVDGRAVETSVVSRVAAKAIGEEQGQDTTYKRFSARIDGRDVALTVSLPRYPNGSDQIVVSLVAQEAMEN